ncbi:hypothetical protein [Ruegeria sp. HKCCD7221]|uniref:hypothetical protein n=1 Tax=Ruegeria sp. HKCCD7221 TaxID=2683009 RepID=UPI001487A58A|nr:hypothetical protein [Ruegeria sp. HKCCD7221]
MADAISHFLAKRLDDVTDPNCLANAAKLIIRFFDGYVVGDINDTLKKEYCQKRRKGRGDKALKDGTLRRELSLSPTAIRRVEEDQLIMRKIAVRLPPKPEG